VNAVSIICFHDTPSATGHVLQVTPAKGDVSQSPYAQSAWAGLSAALERMQESASPRALSDALLAQHFTPTVQLSPSSSVRSAGSAASRKRDPFAPTERYHTVVSAAPPVVVEVYRVAATARSFLLSLLGDLPKVSREFGSCCVVMIVCGYDCVCVCWLVLRCLRLGCVALRAAACPCCSPLIYRPPYTAPL
jgi:hypothetical protein